MTDREGVQWVKSEKNSHQGVKHNMKPSSQIVKENVIPDHVPIEEWVGDL